MLEKETSCSPKRQNRVLNVLCHSGVDLSILMITVLMSRSDYQQQVSLKSQDDDM